MVNYLKRNYSVFRYETELILEDLPHHPVIIMAISPLFCSFFLKHSPVSHMDKCHNAPDKLLCKSSATDLPFTKSNSSYK